MKHSPLPIMLTLLTLAACSKKNSSQFPPPAIRSVTPLTGHYGTEITINGAHLNSAAPIVTIDGVEAKVKAASDTSLIVTVPTTSTGKIVVKTQDSAIGPVFTYTYDIFVGGNMTPAAGGYGTAVYWENGILTQLTDGFNNADIHAITSSGKDVYMGGHEYWGRFRIAKIWKNGIPTALNDHTGDADINCLLLSGNDIYAAGYKNTGGKNIAVIWKNGTPMLLTDGSNDAAVTSITLSGNNLYSAITEYTGTYPGTKPVAKVWINGAITPLTDGQHDGYANAIAVVGNDVYVAGAERDPYGFMISKYWKNGSAVLITTGNSDAYAYSMVAANSYIYITTVYASSYSFDPPYTVSCSVFDAAGNYIPGVYVGAAGINPFSCLAVDGQDVYVAGHVLSGNNWTAAYWKNGAIVPLNNDPTMESVTNTVYIRR